MEEKQFHVNDAEIERGGHHTSAKMSRSAGLAAGVE